MVIRLQLGTQLCPLLALLVVAAVQLTGAQYIAGHIRGRTPSSKRAANRSSHGEATDTSELGRSGRSIRIFCTRSCLSGGDAATTDTKPDRGSYQRVSDL